MAVINFLEAVPKADLTYALKSWQFVSAAAEGPEDACLPFVMIDQLEQAYKISGLGVFHRDRLVGELSDMETRMYGFLTGKAKSAYPSIFIDQKIGTATFRRVKVKAKVKAVRRGDKIEFLFKVRASGFMVELTSSKTDLSLKDIRMIEAKTERSLKKEMLKTIRHLQALNSDILGLGELVRAKLPQVWDRVNWDEEYPRVKVRIDFKFNIERTGTYR